MTAVQFVLFEPVGWVAGNDELKVAAAALLTMMSAQLKSLGDRPTQA